MSTYHPTKHLMKKRLSSWGNFFDKIQQQALNGGLSEEAESESGDFDYNDKLFKAVEEEHCSVRRSLYSEFDVSENSTDSEVDKDPNPKSNKKTVGGVLSDKDCDKASKDPNPKSYKNTEERFVSDKACVRASKALSLLSLGSKKSQKKSANIKIAERTEIPKRLARQSSLSENLSCKRSPRVEKNDDFWKQYEVWKIYRRRKKGKLGSVYIVSNLDEEPSDGNRFIPSFPSDIKKPNFGPRRFILKR